MSDPGLAGHSRSPIGVFDSGAGGLSVLRQIHRQLPHEDIIYVADSGNAPYGERPAPFIEARAHAIVDFLADEGAKAIVVACNTATGVAVDGLRARWRMPIVAIEPAVKPAVSSTRSGVVGVLATSQTIASTRFKRLIEAFSSGVEVIAQACPGLVERIEQGDLSGPDTRVLLERYVAPLLARGADTLVLGCTHYPFVQPLIHEIAGPDVAIIDPADAVARELRRRLDKDALLASAGGARPARFITSGAPDQFRTLLRTVGLDSTRIEPLRV